MRHSRKRKQLLHRRPLRSQTLNGQTQLSHPLDLSWMLILTVHQRMRERRMKNRKMRRIKKMERRRQRVRRRGKSRKGKIKLQRLRVKIKGKSRKVRNKSRNMRERKRKMNQKARVSTLPLVKMRLNLIRINLILLKMSLTLHKINLKSLTRMNPLSKTIPILTTQCVTWRSSTPSQSSYSSRTALISTYQSMSTIHVRLLKSKRSL